MSKSKKNGRLKPIKQPDKYGCGPVSIFNALALNGRKAKLKDLYRECKTGTHPGGGTFTVDWLKVIKSYGFRVRKIKPHNITTTGQYFALITVEDHGDRWGHFVFIKDGIVFNKPEKEIPFLQVGDEFFSVGGHGLTEAAHEA